MAGGRAPRWTPELRVHETGVGCRLTLIGVTYGDGTTLQEAADDLVARVLSLVRGLRSAGIPGRPGLGAPEPEVVEFLWEVGDRAARGGDVRSFVLGLAEESDPAP